MVNRAVARDTVFALRHQIAKLEGRQAQTLDAPLGPADVGTDDAADAAHGHGLVVRRNGIARPSDVMPTGVAAFDEVLGGGLPRAALTEIHAVEMRDAGAAAGFVLALASQLLRQAEGKAALLWIGTADMFHEAGLPYAPGMLERFGIAPEALLLSQAPKLADALWIAEEGARLSRLSAVLIELRGNPRLLDLTATRRLHRRAQEAGRPVFLLRHGAQPEPTAAPLRLIVSSAPSTLRHTLGGPLARSIGPPGFRIVIGKNRMALPGQFELDWNSDALSLQQRRPGHAAPQDSLPVVSVPGHRKDPASASGSVVALRPGAVEAASRHQSPGREHPAHRRSR